MIPKIIHYVWLGTNDFEWSAENKKYFEGYQVMKWGNECVGQFMDIPLFKKYYKEKNYAFCSDIIRLYALKKYGGIYIDTDVDIFGSFDRLLELKSYFGLERVKSDNQLNFLINEHRLSNAIMGCEPNNIIISILYNLYLNDNGYLLTKYIGTDLLTKIVNENGYKIVNSITEAKEVEKLGELPIFNFPAFDRNNEDADYSFLCHKFYFSWNEEDFNIDSIHILCYNNSNERLKNANEIYNKLKNCNSKITIHNSDTSISKSLFHYNIIKESYLNGENKIMIIEDDAIINCNTYKLNEKIIKKIPTFADIAQIRPFGGNSKWEIHYNVNDKNSSTSYVLNRIGMKYYIDFIEKNNYICNSDDPFINFNKSTGIVNYFICNTDLINLKNF